MKEYYFEQYQKSVLKLEMARVGYENKMKEYATQLLNADESTYDSTIKAISLLQTAFAEIREDAEHDKRRYQDA